jgi:hypothetical protein
MICATKNSNKFQKTRFWKEKSVEVMVTLGPTAPATLVSVMEHHSTMPCTSSVQDMSKGITKVYLLISATFNNGSYKF